MDLPLDCLSELKSLYTCLGRRVHEEVDGPTSPGLTKHLVAGLNRMQSLTQLALKFYDGRESSALFKELRTYPVLPRCIFCLQYAKSAT
jgi:hypothetical protein